MYPRLVRIALSACLLAATPPVWAQAQAEPLATKRATDLRDGPSDTARVLSSLPAQTAVTRQTERSGPWMQVRLASGEVGWIHMFDLGNPSSASSGGGIATGLLRGVTGLFNKGGSQTNRTTATATVGIRGLDAQDLANAQPNINAVSTMESYQADASLAQQFAAQAEVQRRDVPNLSAPAGGNASNSDNNSMRNAPL